MQELSGQEDTRIIALDLREPASMPRDAIFECASVTDEERVSAVVSHYEVTDIFHLAGVLSTAAERDPALGHRVNDSGTYSVLAAAQEQTMRAGEPVKVMFTSSIAVYGLRTVAEKYHHQSLKEHEALTPATMYGINKLTAEQLGEYFNRYYGLLQGRDIPRLDFRALRFPGLLSAETVPTGGTSDYAVEMLHTAAQGLSYECFVAPETCIPFMIMPEAIGCLVNLWQAPKTALSQAVYNVRAFSAPAASIAERVRTFFPDATITFNPSPGRQRIVDSWPLDMDDSAARRDWGFRPRYDLERALGEYLVPGVLHRYQGRTPPQLLDLSEGYALGEARAIHGCP